MTRLLLASVLVFQACAQQPYYGDLTYLGTFPSKLSEVSGIDTDAQGRIWAIEDNGNKDRMYQVGKTAQIIKVLSIENAKNDDWEDLTISKEGTVYIGDFGNNDNDRKNLVIYKIDPEELLKKTPKAKKIKFYYPEQKDFPPKKHKRYFDAEGFFHWDGYLYLFTKNRTRPYDGKTLIYRIPDTKGDHKAQLVDTITLCQDQDHCSITAADISEDGKTIALLGYGFVYLLSDFNLPELSAATVKTIYLKHETQMEALCFRDSNTLLLADEQSQTKGRHLYTYQLPKD
ncbi:MAG: hypothetical protein AAGF77_04485 [Bacteroidota bacterium]